MEADFDHEDKYSWYFGQLSRDETNRILEREQFSGVFLVRESKTMPGDFVLCVKEDAKVSHYIVNRIQSGGTGSFKIGDKEFPDIPSLLNFYKTHYLDTTTLIRPAPRARLLCKYEFPGRDPEDLPFKRGEVLELISKDEAEWWSARNTSGLVGQIPVRYIEVIDEDRQVNNGSEGPGYERPQEIAQQPQPPAVQVKLPAKAIVILQRIPSAYDRRQLRLERGEIVTVVETNLNGQWEGEINGRRGIFPFTHVRFLTPEELSNIDA
ncbi:adapter molecule Crk [Aplysia californica]|uniref:Adapter molecule Crk n=1 Tax=Aplysia californica TaxID=6500 RepID=A0ABM0K571_APLCA|nr:adapter molecule Crk [Aplysia californica]